MSEEINLDLLNILVGLLPAKIKLIDLWPFEYQGKITVQLTSKESIDVYQFTNANVPNSILHNFSREVVQEKFNILDLHTKILRKRYRDISEEEKLYLYRYYCFVEKIND